MTGALQRVQSPLPPDMQALAQKAGLLQGWSWQKL